MSAGRMVLAPAFRLTASLLLLSLKRRRLHLLPPSSFEAVARDLSRATARAAPRGGLLHCCHASTRFLRRPLWWTACLLPVVCHSPFFCALFALTPQLTSKTPQQCNEDTDCDRSSTARQGNDRYKTVGVSGSSPRKSLQSCGRVIYGCSLVSKKKGRGAALRSVCFERAANDKTPRFRSSTPSFQTSVSTPFVSIFDNKEREDKSSRDTHARARHKRREHGLVRPFEDSAVLCFLYSLHPKTAPLHPPPSTTALHSLGLSVVGGVSARHRPTPAVKRQARPYMSTRKTR